MPPMPRGGFILIGPPMFGCPVIKQNVGMAAPLGSITNPYGRKKEDSHLEANIKFLFKTAHYGRQYLEAGWGPGCLEGEAVTRGCSREADLAYGGRALGHLGTVETWMAAERTSEEKNNNFIPGDGKHKAWGPEVVSQKLIFGPPDSFGKCERCHTFLEF